MGLKITTLNDKTAVYDITVDKTNNFFANDILVHNCAEIVQYTDEETTAICTLSSVILKNFVENGTFNYQLLYEEVRKIVKALNKVIGINKYSTKKGERGGLNQRAIAIGVQGLADAFFLLDYVFTSDEAKDVNKKIFETIYFAAITESNALCKTKTYTKYSRYIDSPMSNGIFQYDMWGLTENDLSGLWNWKELKESVKKYGICNSLFTAVMPTACQIKETKIRTSEGIKSFEDILIENDIDYKTIEKTNIQQWYSFNKPILVETLNGLNISDKIYYNGHAKVIKIEMEDGTIFECSENHKFLINDNDKNKWIEAKYLKETDDIVNIFSQ